MIDRRKIVLIVDNSRNIPVPSDTVISITHLLLIPGTCSASTIRSGSDIVTIKPSTKLSIAIKLSLRLLLKCEPTYPPIFIVDISTPTLKSAIPTIIISVATRSASVVARLNGKNTRYSTIIIAKNGSMDTALSRHLSQNSFKYAFIIFLLFHYLMLEPHTSPIIINYILAQSIILTKQ